VEENNTSEKGWQKTRKDGSVGSRREGMKTVEKKDENRDQKKMRRRGEGEGWKSSWQKDPAPVSLLNM
jgi:hypothetical protein